MRCNFENIPEKYTEYANKVLSGEIIAGKLIQLTCNRFFEFLKRDDVYFDTDKADKPVNFIYKLKHTESPWTGINFTLEPWQKFIVYCIFGLCWVKNDNRVCRSTYIQISRKCGKSSFAAALSLYGIVADGEIGAQVYLCSPSNSQTQQDFTYVKNYVEGINKGNIFHIVHSKISFDPRKSFIKCLSPKAKLGDGFNPHFAIIDEYHAMDTDDLPNVMISGMASRRQPMMIYITTAGFNIGGPCKVYRDTCVDILKGFKTDDTLWPFIYEIDEEDDWTDSKVWTKCTPSLPEVVTYDFMESRIQDAKNNVGHEVDVRTKNINQWVSSSTVWITDDEVKKLMQPIDLQIFKGQNVYGGIDLASSSDLTAYTLMLPPDEYRKYEPDKFIFKNLYYLPEQCLSEGKNWLQYRTWNQQGYLIVNPGDTTDYQYILDDMIEHSHIMYFNNITYDPFQATFLIVKAEQAGLPCSPFSQSLGNFNKVLQTFEVLERQGKIILDDNPIIRWNFQNIDIYENSTGLRKPIKGTDKSRKIDGAITILQCLGNWLADGGNVSDIAFTS